jgi:hypothetical protein
MLGRVSSQTMSISRPLLARRGRSWLFDNRRVASRAPFSWVRAYCCFRPCLCRTRGCGPFVSPGSTRLHQANGLAVKHNPLGGHAGAVKVFTLQGRIVLGPGDDNHTMPEPDPRVAIAVSEMMSAFRISR